MPTLEQIGTEFQATSIASFIAAARRIARRIIPTSRSPGEISRLAPMRNRLLLADSVQADLTHNAIGHRLTPVAPAHRGGREPGTMRTISRCLCYRAPLVRRSPGAQPRPPKIDSYAVSTTPPATGCRFFLNRPDQELFLDRRWGCCRWGVGSGLGLAGARSLTTGSPTAGVGGAGRECLHWALTST